MPTLPPGTSSEHVVRLRRHLQEYLPSVDQADLCFYATIDSVLFFGLEQFPANVILNQSQFIMKLDTLINDKYQWISISGKGFLAERLYVCEFCTSKDTGSVVSRVELSGPRLDVDKNSVPNARVAVGLFEEIASRLRGNGNGAIADALLAKNGQRRRGIWDHEKLSDFPIDNLLLIERAVQNYIDDLPTRLSDGIQEHITGLEYEKDMLELYRAFNNERIFRQSMTNN